MDKLSLGQSGILTVHYTQSPTEMITVFLDIVTLTLTLEMIKLTKEATKAGLFLSVNIVKLQTVMLQVITIWFLKISNLIYHTRIRD